MYRGREELSNAPKYHQHACRQVYYPAFVHTSRSANRVQQRNGRLEESCSLSSMRQGVSQDVGEVHGAELTRSGGSSSARLCRVDCVLRAQLSLGLLGKSCPQSLAVNLWLSRAGDLQACFHKAWHEYQADAVTTSSRHFLY